ncbi:MAG TPA: NADH-quinone oxidoreductase subunit N [Solirubrobacteraceae bacterium]|nr:NADH-quinone oxidoreductase subunit N [Solirubrobacteraceae bacterium]
MSVVRGLSTLLASIHPPAPHIDYAAIAPFIVLFGGAVVVLLVGLLRSRFVRFQLVPALTLLVLAGVLAVTIWQWNDHLSVIKGALAIDDLTLVMTMLFVAAGAATVILSWRARAPRESAHGEYHALLLSAIAGMSVLVAAQDLITLFIGIELLSIPLYVLCATEMHRSASLESGLKYLIIGSVGSATLLYGLALLYGATGSTSFSAIAASIAAGHSSDALLLTGIALVVVGLAFKASVAPFHQWTPDVYEGAPTPITAFMAVATKAAAFGVLLRMFDVALIGENLNWAPALATLATITIIVGNVGALGQSSLKRMLAYSSVAQAGYIMGGIVVSSQLGAAATIFYLSVYLLMNIAAFAVIIARERETLHGDDIDAVAGLGSERPLLALPLTIAMLSLAGIPATAGFIGKIYLIQALVDGGYTWLGVIIVVGSMISLGYYLRVVAAIWMRDAPGAVAAIAGDGRPLIAGGSEEAASEGRHLEVVLVALAFGTATIFFGIVPQPLFELAQHAASSLTGFL